MKLDLLIRNANIRTGAPTRPHAHSLGVWQGRVVGLDDEVEGLSAHEHVDVHGQFVMAGFNDAHAHSVWFGISLGEVDLSGVATPAQAYSRLQTALRSTQHPDEWIAASLFDPLGMAGRIDRDELDSVSDGHPIVIKHSSGHALTLNGVALRRLNLDQAPVPRIDGGKVVVDDAGRPTGLLEENAMMLAQSALAPTPVVGTRRALARATRAYAAEGLTSVTDAGICGGWIGHGAREFMAYQDARDSGDLLVRSQVMFASDTLHALAGHSSELDVLSLDGGIRTGAGDEFLQIGPAKMFLDGSLLGRTAAMQENYVACSHHGYLTADAADLQARAMATATGGWSLALHAIGDRAVDLALEILSRTVSDHGRPNIPHRIEHGGFVREDQLRTMAQLGVFLVTQPNFIPAFGDGMAAALGPGRAASSYPAASVIASGMPLAGSSDRPVAPGAPLHVIQAAVLRRTQSGKAYAPSERLSVEAALDSYTVGSAAATGWATTKGRLSRGYFADFVVLGADPRSVAPAEISSIPVLATYVGGHRTF